MDSDRKYKVAESVHSQLVDGELVILDMKTEKYFGLDSVGSDIWKLIDEENSFQEILDAMLEMYDADPDQVNRDIEDLIEKLLTDNLIEPV